MSFFLAKNAARRFLKLIPLFFLGLAMAACNNGPTPSLPPSTEPAPIGEPAPTDEEALPPVADPGSHGHPTLADFWTGEASFVVEVEDTGLPMGESDTVIMANGELWSYVHASAQSAGVVDSCGDPVPFPGCMVIYKSTDGGYTFSLDERVCRLACNQCPCTSTGDHIDQQQYPRVAWDGERFNLVYEYRAMVMLVQSGDGYNWTPVGQIPTTGIWHYWFRNCTKAESIGIHPFAPYDYQCLVGGPPGIAVDGETLYIFVALGQNPGAMGCYKGPVGGGLEDLVKCDYNPLFSGVRGYGPLDDTGPATNPYFSFRTISSAEVQRVGERYYMLYEGVRGPAAGDGGDTQFALGLARTISAQLDGPWETYAGNPILVDMPGNVGVGHADLVVIEGKTILYTSLDGVVRSRLALVWSE